MLTRFELYLAVRNQVRDRGHLRRALALEAALEELAPAAGGAAALWGLAGLGARIDELLVAANPERRGAAAAELLATEGAPPEVVEAVGTRLAGDPATLTPLAAALAAAEPLVDDALDAVEAGEPLDALDPRALAHALRRAATARGDEAALRILACLARAGLEPTRAAELVLLGLRRVRSDLRL